MGDDLAQDVVGVADEVVVDGDLDHVVLADDLDAGGGQPVRLDGCAALFAAAEDEHVGDHRGASGLLVGSLGQADRADQVGQGNHLFAHRHVGGRIQRPAGGDDGQQPTGAGQVQAFEDEVVVDAVAVRVVPAVGQGEHAERHVADGQVEGAVGDPGVGEGLVQDARVRIQQGGDLGGRGFEFHADQVGALGGRPEEVAAAAAGLQHAPLGEAEVGDGLPHLPDQGGVGVVGVEDVAGRGP
ncbi:hypothetical protein GCM10022248_89620 [Nonomuraea soli]